jgi:hypothetical protein
MVIQAQAEFSVGASDFVPNGSICRCRSLHVLRPTVVATEMSNRESLVNYTIMLRSAIATIAAPSSGEHIVLFR